MRTLPLIAAACLLGACVTAPPTAAQPNPQPTPAPSVSRAAPILGGEGTQIGSAVFTSTPGGVLIRLEFVAGALPQGWHGAHLHERGDCSDAAAGFRASGAHIKGPGDHDHAPQHGLHNPAGPEAGDLPNLYAPEAGAFGAEFFNGAVSLDADGARAQLLDADGSALIVHANPDDHTSQPIGGAGARLACAALSP